MLNRNLEIQTSLLSNGTTDKDKLKISPLNLSSLSTHLHFSIERFNDILFIGISLYTMKFMIKFSKANHNPWIKYFMEEETRRMILQVHDDEQCEHCRFLSVDRSSLKSLITFTVNLSRCILFSVISKTLVLSPLEFAEVRSSIVHPTHNPRNIIIFER